VWAAIHAAGTPRGLRACGLGARDTLRLEAGMPLYGHELVATTDPFAIGLGLAFHFDSADGRPRTFPGIDAFRRMRDATAPQVRVGIVFDSKRSAREGAEVQLGGRRVGTVSSGSFAPTVGAAVAMALVDRAATAPGTAVDVMIRDTAQAGRIAPLPFYQRPRG
jgi:aminomethyltransferase